MRALTLSISVVALALCLDAARLPAQQPGNRTFEWYIGGSGGILNFKTTIQGYGTIPMAGAQLLVTARRTGLLLSVEEGFGSNEVSTYTDGAGGTQVVTFDDVRKYSATLMAFPLNIPIQPYLGIGVGILHVVDPSHSHEGSTAANELGSTGFGSLIGGVQFKLARFVGFGQYQITTGASIQQSSDFGPRMGTGRLIEGPTHTFSAGLRIGLGNARERATGGGY